MKNLSSALCAGLLCIGSSALAQKKAVNSANNYIVTGELDRAKTEIEAAVVNESTKDDPRAWFVRGEVYRVLRSRDTSAAGRPNLQTSAESFMRAAELGSKDGGLNERLDAVARDFYNEGVREYNAKNYDQAFDLFNWPVRIRGLENGVRFRDNKQIDFVAGLARVYQGFCALQLQRYADASTAFEAAKTNPAAVSADVYLGLIEAYEKQNMGDKTASLIAEGRAKFADNKGLQAAELNSMMKSGEMDKVTARLEAAVATEPNNALYQYNLAYAYMNMGTATKRPPNYRDLLEKSEAAFRKAIALDLQNVDFVYNLGVLFYNQAVTYTEEMNKITGTTDGEIRRYEAIKVQRNALFVKAQEPFEKSMEMLFPRKASLNADEQGMYTSVVTGLTKIYDALDLNDKLKAHEARTK